MYREISFLIRSQSRTRYVEYETAISYTIVVLLLIHVDNLHQSTEIILLTKAAPILTRPPFISCLDAQTKHERGHRIGSQ